MSRFLTDVVNLNQTRIDTLESRVGTIQTFLTNSGWTPKIRGFSPQGSWAHRTIIKPSNGRLFDADLVVFVDPVAGWNATDYVVGLRGVFPRIRSLPRARIDDHTLRDSDLCRRFLSRCCSLRCRSAVAGHTWRSAIEATTSSNRRARCAIRPGFKSATLWIGSNHLQHVVRLIKYLRDIKGTFSAKSILLTTLVGSQINPADAQPLNRQAWFSRSADRTPHSPRAARQCAAGQSRRCRPCEIPF